MAPPNHPNRIPTEDEIVSIMTPSQLHDIDKGFRFIGFRVEHDRALCCWTGPGEMIFYATDKSIKDSLARRWPDATEQQISMAHIRIAKFLIRKIKEADRLEREEIFSRKRFRFGSFRE